MNRYLPFPRIGKICSSITRAPLNPLLTEEEFFERTLALCFLSFPCVTLFNILVKYLEFLYEHATYQCVLRQILLVNDLDFMYRSFLKLHLGWEGNSSQPNAFNGGIYFFLPPLEDMVGFKSICMQSSLKKNNVQRTTNSTQAMLSSTTEKKRKRPKKKAVINTSLNLPVTNANGKPRIVVSPTEKEVKQLIAAAKATTKKGDRLVYTVTRGARLWIEALLNPFETEEGVSVPDGLIPLPSSKAKLFNSGTFVVGTGGVGYIAMLPAWTTNAANIVMTTVTSVGTKATLFSAFTNLSTVSFPNAPVANADLSNTDLRLCQARGCGCGIRIAYVGALQNQNGVIYSYTQPDKQAITGNWAPQDVEGDEKTVKTVVTGHVHQGADGGWLAQAIDLPPVIELEKEFVGQSSVFTAPIMVIVVEGTAGDKYMWEAVQHVEYIGEKVEAFESPSDVDPLVAPAAAEAVREFSSNLGPIQQQDGPHVLTRIKDKIMENLPSLAEKVAGLAGKAASAVLPPIISGLGQVFLKDQESRETISESMRVARLQGMGILESSNSYPHSMASGPHSSRLVAISHFKNGSFSAKFKQSRVSMALKNPNGIKSSKLKGSLVNTRNNLRLEMIQSLSDDEVIFLHNLFESMKSDPENCYLYSRSRLYDKLQIPHFFPIEEDLPSQAVKSKIFSHNPLPKTGNMEPVPLRSRQEQNPAPDSSTGRYNRASGSFESC